MKTPAYQQLVLHAVELMVLDGDGFYSVASLVAQSHPATITDVFMFRSDVRHAYLAQCKPAYAARFSAHDIGPAKFEGHDAEGLAIYSNVSI